MKTFNYTLGEKTLYDTIDIAYLLTQKSILVQIFCGKGYDVLKAVTNELSSLLPHAIIIGTTTDGEIQDHNIYTKQTVMSVSVFEKTDVKSSFVSGDNSFVNGKELAENLIESNTKLIIVFSDGTTTNGEEFLKGIESVNNRVVIAGGMAGDNGEFIQTFISEGSNILNQGAVGVSLNSDSLYIHNDYSFNWSPVGVEHKIDRVQANRVYSIDGITPVDFYAKYLGNDVADALPATGIEFPLIIEKNGIKIARAVIAKHDDGSLSFAGNLNSGDIVRLGFGNAEMIINNPRISLEKFCDVPIETFFLYSCMARRRYMPGFIQVEIEPFARLAPTVGFFTYAEFYHHKQHNELLNQTLTAVALSESCESEKFLHYSNEVEVLNEYSEYATTIKALTHLIAQSVSDLEDQSKKLAIEKKYSQELLVRQKLFMRHAIHETVTPLAVIMSNIELYELEYGRNSYLSNIEAAMKNVFTIYDDLSYLVKKDQMNYPTHNMDFVEYLRSRIDFFTEVALQSNLSFCFESDVEEMIVKFNETKLQRVIDNNLTNAIKYTLENETILISLNGTKVECIVTISSKSTHIQNQKKIFEPFYREGISKDGFGLGLNLVNQICDEEDVTIKVVSNEDITSFSYIFKLER
ncbi:MAG: FIST C-terminal domain-containing protein [Sulfurimonas sp.]|nr:FIST C-terminal domain-containing protein [Sulfurimonas sp.]